jgi:hypothetical protein
MSSRLADVSTPEPLQSRGPYVSVAVFCEKILQEQDGALSLIRVTDTINQSAVGPDAPREMRPFIADITLVVMLKSGEARGSYGVMLRPEAPGGFQMPPFEQTVHLQGGAWGAAIIMPLQLPISEQGVYWFDVFLTDPTTEDSARFLSRIPLEVVYHRAG